MATDVYMCAWNSREEMLSPGCELDVSSPMQCACTRQQDTTDYTHTNSCVHILDVHTSVESETNLGLLLGEILVHTDTVNKVLWERLNQHKSTCNLSSKQTRVHSQSKQGGAVMQPPPQPWKTYYHVTICAEKQFPKRQRMGGTLSC